MKKLYYNVIVEKAINISSENLQKFIHDVLTDKRGWVGYSFININYPKKINKITNFSIIMSKPENIVKNCGNALYGLSCTNTKTKIIYLNSNRYIRGAKKSQLSLVDYRIYLINHEVGHILGKGHTKCPCDKKCDKKVPVMNQATRGIGHCKPNPYPTTFDNNMKSTL